MFLYKLSKNESLWQKYLAHTSNCAQCFFKKVAGAFTLITIKKITTLQFEFN